MKSTLLLIVVTWILVLALAIYSLILEAIQQSAMENQISNIMPIVTLYSNTTYYLNNLSANRPLAYRRLTSREIVSTSHCPCYSIGIIISWYFSSKRYQIDKSCTALGTQYPKFCSSSCSWLANHCGRVVLAVHDGQSALVRLTSPSLHLSREYREAQLPVPSSVTVQLCSLEKEMWRLP